MSLINFRLIGLFVLIASSISFAEVKEDETMQEGKLIYKAALAIELGNEIINSKYPAIKGISSTQVAYTMANKSVCVFFSDADPLKIIFSLSFNSEARIENANVDTNARNASLDEQSLYNMTKAMEADVKSTSFYKKYGNTKFTLVPINDYKGKRAYVLTTSEKEGVITFGNDYLISFDSNNSISKRNVIHRNLMWTEINAKEKENDITEAWHTHLPETGNKITATDIYNIVRYEKVTRWKKYSVITETLVSIWNCETDSLAFVPRQQWDKIFVKK